MSTAIPATNPEVVEAARRGIPVHRRAEALRALADYLERNPSSILRGRAEEQAK